MASLAGKTRSRLNKAGDAQHDPADTGPVVTEQPPPPAETPAATTATEPVEAPAAPKRTATRASRSKTSKSSTATAAGTEPPSEPVVLTPTTRDAERIGLYVHRDDYRALYEAKLDDRADANARLRAMIALWRSNARYRATVDRLARTAPRGPHSGRA